MKEDTNYLNLLAKLSYHFWGHHGSVDSSAPSILRSRVRIQSTSSTLIPITVKFCAISVIAWKKGPNNEMEARFGLLKKLYNHFSTSPQSKRRFKIFIWSHCHPLDARNADEQRTKCLGLFELIDYLQVASLSLT